MNDEQTEKSPTTTANSAKVTTELAGLQRAAVVVLGLFVRVWTRSLRLHYDTTVKTLINPDRKPAVVILWHNRLLLAPELFRRNFPERKMAGLISASSDGANNSRLCHKITTAGFLSGFMSVFTVVS